MIGAALETGLVYAVHGAAWAIAVRRVGFHPAVTVLGLAMCASWAIGEAYAGPTRDVLNIMVDLSTVITLMVCRQHCACGARDRLIALVAQSLIFWRCVHIGGGQYIDHWAFAAVVNCAVLLQLLIAGGLVDVIGRSIDHRLGRLHRGLQRALRVVAS